MTHLTAPKGNELYEAQPCLETLLPSIFGIFRKLINPSGPVECTCMSLRPAPSFIRLFYKFCVFLFFGLCLLAGSKTKQTKLLPQADEIRCTRPPLPSPPPSLTIPSSSTTSDAFPKRTSASVIERGRAERERERERELGGPWKG